MVVQGAFFAFCLPWLWLTAPFGSWRGGGIKARHIHSARAFDFWDVCCVALVVFDK
jgi:hypothetical protein